MKLRKWLLLIFSFVVIGCAPSVFVNYKDASFSAGQIQNQSTVRVNVISNINVMEFKRSFIKEFGSDKQFVSSIQKKISDIMSSILNCGKVIVDTLQALPY